MEPNARQFVSWIPVLLWMAVIFALSSVPDLKSGLQPLWDLVLRKMAHAFEYTALSWLVYRALRTHGLAPLRAFFGSFVFAFLYAATDEYHQTFVPGRTGALLDVMIDSLGALVGSSISLRRNQHRNTP